MASQDTSNAIWNSVPELYRFVQRVFGVAFRYMRIPCGQAGFLGIVDWIGAILRVASIYIREHLRSLDMLCLCIAIMLLTGGMRQ